MEIKNDMFSGYVRLKEGMDYFVDMAQRSVLFCDVLRERGNGYLDHLEKGQPPVLVFEYESIVDGRELSERPANYALARIIDRRVGKAVPPEIRERRQAPELISGGMDVGKRPIVIIDPRAGQGPGIGGAKQNSEIGMALSYGHPVYFVLFFTDPMPGQLLADVKNAEIVFLEEICRRHPDAPRPAVIGNCQGGVGAALLAADRPDLVGSLMLNGSPLSYWSGLVGDNPMRYTGGLVGGVWLNSFLGDLGNGRFDGANLLWNMIWLSPGKMFWTKFYNLYSKVDTDAEQFLKFERWWGGFFMFTTAEIHQIVEELFVGNRLVRGTFELEEGKKLDLRHFSAPVVVFASEGDNIAPPQQALNWIPMVYESEEEIERHGQVVVYMVHPEIGHLGIFVSGAIAQKEQKEMISSVEMLNYLSPGLYEMVIVEKPSREWMNDYRVKFEERTLEDIMSYDDGVIDEIPFQYVVSVSEFNDLLYIRFARPFVRAMVTSFSAELLRQCHPLRARRYLLSDLNPLLIPVKLWAPFVREHRRSIDGENLFVRLERTMADYIAESWNIFRDARGSFGEMMFKAIYNHPVTRFFFREYSEKAEYRRVRKEKHIIRERSAAKDSRKWRAAIEQGGFTEGLIRILIDMASVDGAVDAAELKVVGKVPKIHDKFKGMETKELQRIIKEQSRILQTDRERALEALSVLIPRQEDRNSAIELAVQIARADEVLRVEETELIGNLKQILQLY